MATATGAATSLVSIPGVEQRVPRALAFAASGTPGVVPSASAEYLGARGNALAGALALIAAGESFFNGNSPPVSFSSETGLPMSPPSALEPPLPAPRLYTGKASERWALRGSRRKVTVWWTTR